MGALRALWLDFRRAAWEVRSAILLLLLLVTAHEVIMLCGQLFHSDETDWRAPGIVFQIAIALTPIGLILGLLSRTTWSLWLTTILVSAYAALLIGTVFWMGLESDQLSRAGVYVLVVVYARPFSLALIPILLLVSFFRGSYDLAELK